MNRFGLEKLAEAKILRLGQHSRYVCLFCMPNVDSRTINNASDDINDDIKTCAKTLDCSSRLIQEKDHATYQVFDLAKQTLQRSIRHEAQQAQNMLDMARSECGWSTFRSLQHDMHVGIVSLRLLI